MLYCMCKNIHHIDSCKAECDGCRNGGTQANDDCYHLQAPEVYACSGTWSDCGLSCSSDAQAICADGYEICPSATRTAELGLDRNECGNIDGVNKFYASLETSSGSGDCTTDDPDNDGSNDVWGCADMETSGSGQDVAVWCSGSTCRGQTYASCKNSLMAFISKEDFNLNGDWSNGKWTFDLINVGNSNEVDVIKLTDSTYGGVCNYNFSLCLC